MVQFNNPNKRDYKNSSTGFTDYIDKLNRQHPTKSIDIGEEYNYGMNTSVHALRDQQRRLVHDKIAEVKKEQREQLQKIRQEQKRLRKGKPDGFI